MNFATWKPILEEVLAEVLKESLPVTSDTWDGRPCLRVGSHHLIGESQSYPNKVEAIYIHPDTADIRYINEAPTTFEDAAGMVAFDISAMALRAKLHAWKAARAA